MREPLAGERRAEVHDRVGAEDIRRVEHRGGGVGSGVRFEGETVAVTLEDDRIDRGWGEAVEVHQPCARAVAERLRGHEDRGGVAGARIGPPFPFAPEVQAARAIAAVRPKRERDEARRAPPKPKCPSSASATRRGSRARDGVHEVEHRRIVRGEAGGDAHRPAVAALVAGHALLDPVAVGFDGGHREPFDLRRPEIMATKRHAPRSSLDATAAAT